MMSSMQQSWLFHAAFAQLAVLPAHNRAVAGSSPASGIFDILTVRIFGRFLFCTGGEEHDSERAAEITGRRSCSV